MNTKQTLQPDDGSTQLVKGIICGIVGAFLIVWGGFLVKFAWDEYQMSQWPTTEGTITGRSAKEYQKLGAAMSGSKSDITVELKIQYSFHVSGKEYYGERYSIKADRVPSLTPEEAKQKFLIGTKHTIHYSPGDPSDSYIDSKFEMRSLVGSIAIVAVGVFLLPVMVVLILKSRRPVIKADRDGCSGN